jgi:hypothetical protein
MLTIHSKAIEFVNLLVERSLINNFLIIYSPVSVLNARRKMICPFCTLHPNRPFMVEEGREWITHQNTRAHKSMASKARREPYGTEGHSLVETKKNETIAKLI